MLNRRRALMAKVASSGGLPDEYQQVEWISGGGQSYINTGIIPTTKSAMKAVMAAAYQSTSNFLGSRDADSGTDKAFAVASYSSAHKFGFMRWGYGVQTIAFDTNWHEMYLTETEAKVDGVSYALSAPKDQTSTRVIYLFRDNKTNSAAIEISLKYFKFWDNGNLIADYVPCYRKSDSVIGMYDKASQAFLTNDGLGTFTKGADVN